MSETPPIGALAEPALQFLRSLQLMVRLAKEPTIGSRPADFYEAAKMAHNDFKFLQLLASKTPPSSYNIHEIVKTIHGNLVALVKHLRDVVESGAALEAVPAPIGESIWRIAESVKQIVAAAQHEAANPPSNFSASTASGPQTLPAGGSSPSMLHQHPAVVGGPNQSPPSSNTYLPPQSQSAPSLSSSGPQEAVGSSQEAMPPQILELDLTKVQSGVRALGVLTDIFFGENRGQNRSHVAPAAAELTKHSFELQVAAKQFDMQEYAVKLMEKTTDVLFTVKQAVATREHPEAMAAFDDAVKSLAALFKEFVRACAQNGVALITSAQPAPAPVPASVSPATSPNMSLMHQTQPIEPAAVPSTSPRGGEMRPADSQASAQNRDSLSPRQFPPGSGTDENRPVSGELSSQSEGDDSDEEEALADIMDTLSDAFADLSVEQGSESPESTSPLAAAATNEPAVTLTPPTPTATVPLPVSIKPIPLPKLPAKLPAMVGPVAPVVPPTSSATPSAAPGGEVGQIPPTNSERRKRYPVPPKRAKKAVVVEEVNLGGPAMPTPATASAPGAGDARSRTSTATPPVVPRKTTKTTKALKQFLTEAARPAATSSAAPLSSIGLGSLPPPKTGADILNLWETLEHLILTVDMEKMQSRARWDLHNQRKEERANREVSFESTDDSASKSKGSSFFIFKKFIGGNGTGTSSERTHSSSNAATTPRGLPKQPAARPVPNRAPNSPPPSADPSKQLNWSASRGSLRRPLLSSVGLEDVNDPRVEKFEAPDSDDIIRFSDDGSRVIGGTIEKLIQRLTYDSFPDPQFMQSFMMTYRTFLTPRELMTLLELRWNSRPPADQDLEAFCKERMLPIRLRVFNVLKTWVEKFFIDFQGDDTMVDSIREFVKRLERAGMIQPASQLLNALERRLEGAIGLVGTAFPGQQPPAPYPHTGLRFRDFHPVEVARQLTIAESTLFRAVQPHELLDVSWTKKDKETKSPNVLAMIRFSNHVISWISAEIVTPEDVRERGLVLNRFIAVAQAALQLNNFNAAMEVVSALHNASVYRLQSTWNMLPDETWTAVEALERLFESDDNFKNYRSALERAVPPCVPYLGRYLSDLLFIEEKHQRMLDDSLINFGKLDTISSTIGAVELYQKSPYALAEVPDIINHIKNSTAITERDLYNTSLQREARKAK